MVSVIIAAAGNASRMDGIHKQFVCLDGIPVLVRSCQQFCSLQEVLELIIVTKAQEVDTVRLLLEKATLQKPVKVVAGGTTRQQSIEQGFLHCDVHSDFIAIHDGARPLVDPDDIAHVIQTAYQGKAAALGVPAKDTIKVVDASNLVQSTPNRDFLYVTQTPQVFEKSLYRIALNRAEGTYTDDCQLFEQQGIPVTMVRGKDTNIKITTPVDLVVAEAILSTSHPQKEKTNMRIGHGYDVHQLIENRPLILGGVTVPHTLGLLGHSDADVLTHAMMDALLGALALGDIGNHFPDTEDAYANVDSCILLEQVMALIEAQNYHLVNLDATILAQKPKLAPYLSEMRAKLAQICHAEITQISIKATTEEGLGFTGAQQGIAAHCVCLLEKNIV